MRLCFLSIYEFPLLSLSFCLVDLFGLLLQIVSAQTDFQRVDIYDVLRPHFQSLESYKESLRGGDSYEAQNPELFEPDRIVFLDGVLQSRKTGDAAYHEALVHPSMFAHKNPKRVAIIGGGEGATLREVLKHKTLEKVVMIEIDEKMVSLSREYLPYWSDCSNLEGSTDSCFDDPRVEMYYQDAFKWFIDRFGNDDGSESSEDPFDVIIMDALYVFTFAVAVFRIVLVDSSGWLLHYISMVVFSFRYRCSDPQVQKDFVDALYGGGPFLSSLYNAVSSDGVFVAQVGQAPDISSPSEEHSLNKNKVKFINSLADLGFESISDYEEVRKQYFFLRILKNRSQRHSLTF